MLPAIPENLVEKFEVHAMSKSAPQNDTVDGISQFNISDEIGQAERTKPWPSGIHARTLLKKSDLRVVLIAMEKGAKMNEHHADGTISLQPVKGQIRVRTMGEAHELQVGQLFTLDASIKHDVESLDDSAFLLTIAWPTDQQLRAIPHRGYGS